MPNKDNINAVIATIAHPDWDFDIDDIDKCIQGAIKSVSPNQNDPDLSKFLGISVQSLWKLTMPAGWSLTSMGGHIPRSKAAAIDTLTRLRDTGVVRWI